MKNFILCLILAGLSLHIKAKVKVKHIIQVDNIKEYKKVLKTHKNVLTIYSKEDKPALPLIRWMEEVAKDVKGKGTFVYINCGETKESKKLCKKFDIKPRPTLLKHYKDGVFHKDYDRKDTPKSMLNFMLDPAGDAPWEEDPSSENVVHVTTEKDLIKLRRKEKGPLLIMFYAPWCTYCKKLKPEYALAANELKDKAVLAGMNVDKPETQNVRYEFNITGFPTIVYFEKGEKKFNFGGGMDKEGIITWMANPEEKVEEKSEDEEDWSEQASEILHLTDATFEESLKQHPSILIMFYAPWCGHCKKMKPEYVSAAQQMKEEEVPGTLAAIDCTVAKDTCTKYDVSGYPTVKYFAEAEFKFKISVREKDKVIEFMKKPEAPPPPPPEDLPWPDVSGPEILHLEDGNSKEILKKKKHVLVMFYAPWCGHCKKAKPEIEAAAEHYKDDRKIWFAGVDCTTQTKFCAQYNVEGYPTFRYFLYGKKDFKYSGGRQTQGFIDFMANPQEKSDDDSGDDIEPPQWKDTPSGVVHLEDSDFDEFVKTHSSVLVMFYAPWCGHCKSMKPDYTEAANELLNQDHVLAAVDCTQNRKTASKYNIEGYPTLKYYKDGEGKEYDGGRTKSSIMEYLSSENVEAEESVEPGVEEPGVEEPAGEAKWSDTNKDVIHLTDDTFNEFINTNPAVFVMFYAPWCPHCKVLRPVFAEAAEIVNNGEEIPGKLAAVDCSTNEKVCEIYKVKSYPKGTYFKDGKDEYDYNHGRKVKDIVNFMKDPKPAPPKKPKKRDGKPWSEEDQNVIHLTGKTYNEFIEGETSALVMFYAPWCGHCKKMKPQYSAAAKLINKNDKYDGKLAAFDCTAEENKNLCESLGVQSFPTVKYYKNGKDEFKYSGGREVDDFIDFMRDPKPAAPEPVQLPWSEENQDVAHLTEKTFQKFVEAETSVLVMFYAPWCGHCKKMKPEYAAAAKLINADDKVAGKLAAVDCIPDESKKVCETYEVKSFPTLKYFKNGKEEFKYGSGRKTDDIVEFMKDPKPPPPKTVEKPWSEENQDVVHLTEETFKTFVKGETHVLVMFYAPWCQHCKTIKPAFAEAAKLVNMDDKIDGKLAAVDCDANPKLNEKYEIKGYPTLKYFRKGLSFMKYQGPREAPDFVDFMKTADKKTQNQWSDEPSDVHHLTNKTFHDFIKDKDALVMFYAPWCGHCNSMKAAYAESAKLLKDDNFPGVLAAIDSTNARNLSKDEGVKGFPTLRYYSNGEFVVKFEEHRTVLNLVAFMKKQFEPVGRKASSFDDTRWIDLPSPVTHLSSKDFHKVLNSKDVPHVLVVFHVKWCRNCLHMRNVFMRVSSRLGDYESLSIAAIDCDTHTEKCSDQGVTSFPTMKYYSFGTFNENYSGKVDTDSVLNYMLSKLKEGKEEL